MGDEDEESNTFSPPTHQQQPNPTFVMKRYWKSLFVWPLFVFLLVLAATLPPVFVERSNTSQEECDEAMMELTKAADGIREKVHLAFIPAASLGLWVTGKPNFLEQIEGSSVQIDKDYYAPNAPFQIATRQALELAFPNLRPIDGVALAPHATVSAIFPIVDGNSTKPLGANLLLDPLRRKGILHTIFSAGFSLEGPLFTYLGDILVTRFPVFYEASNCSCSASSPTSNDVIFRSGNLSNANSFEDVIASNITTLYQYGKLADIPQRFPPSPGGRFPTEVVFQTRGGIYPTMFCDVNAGMGLMGLDPANYGIEWVNMSIEYLPKCRFFWGLVTVVFDYQEFLESGQYLRKLERAGYVYKMTKLGYSGEIVTLAQSNSSDFFNTTATPKSTNITLPSQSWTLSIVPKNNENWGSDNGWKWQLGLAFVGAFFLAFVAFVIVFIVAYRKQYLKNVAEEFSLVTSDAMVQKKRAEASEKAAIENEAVAKKFLSTMSHELRTPLNSILAVSELMVLDPPNSQRGDSSASPLIQRKSPKELASCSTSSSVRDCELIHDSARFLKQIVDDVLDFNKIEMGCLVISSNRFSPTLALQSVARLALPLIKDPSLYFRLNVDPLTPKTVTTDEHRFKQIIMNLASNAIKFIKEGGLTISLSTVCLSSLPLSSICSLSGSSFPRSVSHSPCYLQKWEDRLQKCPQDRLREIVRAHRGEGDGRELFVYVDVEDTGPGMTNEQQRKLFQPYYQSDPKRDAKAGGSGLGLSICADLCKVMGGVIWVTDPMREEGDRSTSERQRGGKGTSFRFLLPLLGAEGRVSPDLIESLLVVDGGSKDASLDSSFCQIETSIEEELGQEEGRVEIEEFEPGEEEDVRESFEKGRGIEGTTNDHEDTNEPISLPQISSHPPNPQSPDSISRSSPASPASPVQPSSSSSLPASPVLRVLLIDDSKLNRLVFVRMIKSLVPCEVDEAENGEDGIKMAVEGEEEYNLVVCDLNMEGKTGLEVGEELRRSLGYSFVMALFTADVMLELGEGERGLFEVVLYKPLSRESLIEFLVRFMDGKFFPEDFPPKVGKKKRKGKKKVE